MFCTLPNSEKKKKTVAYEVASRVEPTDGCVTSTEVMMVMEIQMICAVTNCKKICESANQSF